MLASTSLLAALSAVMGRLPPPFLKQPNTPLPLLSVSVCLVAVRALAGNAKHITRQMTLKAAPTPLQDKRYSTQGGKVRRGRKCQFCTGYSEKGRGDKRCAQVGGLCRQTLPVDHDS